MNEEIAVNVRIIPSREILKKEIDKITLKKGSSIEDLINILCENYLKRSEEGRQINVLRGYILMKNSVTVGIFDKDGFKPFKEADLQLKDGDEVTIMFPPSGG